MTAYAAAQLVLAVPALVLFVLNVVGGVLAVIVVGIPLLLLTIPATRWIANRHRAMAGRVLGTPIPPQYRPPRPAALVARLVGWASRPDDLARPGLARWSALHPRLRARRCSCVLLLVLVVTGALWWFGDRAAHAGAVARWTGGCSAYGHTETLEQRVAGAHRDAAPRPSTTRPPSCAASSATCTTAPRPGWSRCR